MLEVWIDYPLCKFIKNVFFNFFIFLFQWYNVDKKRIREDILKLWLPLGDGPNHDLPDASAIQFLETSIEKSDSLFLQTWHSVARSALSWFISRTSING